MITAGYTLFHHSGIMGKYVYAQQLGYVIPINTKSYAFCVALPHDIVHFLLPSAVQSMLLTHYQITKECEHMGRLPLVTH